MYKITHLPEWQHLVAHQKELKTVHLKNLLATDAQRFQKFSINAARLCLDYSKNHIDETTINLLCKLAETLQLTQHIEALFSGKAVNVTENRPALHTALRHQADTSIYVDGKDVMPNIKKTLAKMAAFCETVHNPATHQSKITDIVNIGIGGSDLGPNLSLDALTPYLSEALQFHFIANIDNCCMALTLKKLKPETTLFIISSKSFKTIETLHNAQTAMQWFQQNALATTCLAEHFIAVTSKPDLAIEIGIAEKNIFMIEDWVGGRYSIWSAIGLPLMLGIGNDHFQQLLAGAYAMDQHFQQAPLQQNMPVILGLLNIWYNNFFDTRAHAILPYDQSLHLLPLYLQQAEMESTGKQVTTKNDIVDYPTGQIIFGEVGTNSQHTFFQLLHQGTQLIPVDFIVPMRNHYPDSKQHAILVANAFSQSKALAEGDNTPANQLTPYKISLGNRPSNMILMQQLTPYTFGALLALYEHKIFVQSVIWQINAFDQWGVELGKQLAHKMLPYLLNCNTELPYDNATNHLIKFYQENK